MGILAVYDTVGVQNYIFASNRLAENVGGSKLVADVFGNNRDNSGNNRDSFGLLREAIKDKTGINLANWKSNEGLNGALKAEIIYQGGGNAFVAFADEPTFQDVTKEFLVSVCESAPGLGIAVAAVETDFGDTYKSDIDRVTKRLAVTKGGFINPVFAGNQPITKQSVRTGLPVSAYRSDEYLSISQIKKRDRYDRYRKDSKSKSKIKEFSDLVFSKGSDSLIAIIHADGNNMRSKIMSFMKNPELKSYDTAVPAIRKLSSKIDACYQSARELTIQAFKDEYAAYLAVQKAKGQPVPMKDGKPFDEPPVLKLIGDGDDTTLVTGGRFALDIAARLLREIESTPENKRPFEDSVPTACAGVALFHCHYPFSEAYKLAEELCKGAKKLSRGRGNEGSYIDFHLHQSGNVSGLSELRERQYVIDGKTILRRPWRLTSSTCSTYPGNPVAPDYRWFKTNIEFFRDVKKIPHSKSMALRNAISAGDTAAKIAESQMREIKLPELPDPPKQLDPPQLLDHPTASPPRKMSRYAPYFDVLELHDVYENLLNKEKPNKEKEKGTQDEAKEDVGHE